jgi:hypothetical protein
LSGDATEGNICEKIAKNQQRGQGFTADRMLLLRAYVASLEMVLCETLKLRATLRTGCVSFGLRPSSGQKTAARMFGVSPPTVSRIVAAHVGHSTLAGMVAAGSRADCGTPTRHLRLSNGLFAPTEATTGCRDRTGKPQHTDERGPIISEARPGIPSSRFLKCAPTAPDRAPNLLRRW